MKKRSILTTVGGTLLLLLIAVGLAIHFYVPHWMRQQIDHSAKELGFSQLKYHLEHVDANSLSVGNISFNYQPYPGAIAKVSAKHATVHYSAHSLVQKRVKTILIDGLHLKLILPKAQQEKVDIKIPVLPFEKLRLKNSHMHVERVGYPQQNITISGLIEAVAMADMFQFELFGDVYYKEHPFSVNMVAYHRVSTDSGDMNFTLNLPNLTAHHLRVNHFIAGLPVAINFVHGRLTIQGKLHWVNEKRVNQQPLGSEYLYGFYILPTFTLEAKDLSGSIGDALFEKLSGKLNVLKVRPLQTEKLQTLTIGKLTEGVTLQNVALEYQLQATKTKQQRLFIHKISAQYGGGKIYSENIHIDQGELKQQFELRLEALELGELLQVFQQEDLAVTGLINGYLPVTLSPQGISILHGKLHTLSGGIIKYTPKKVPKVIKETGNTGELALEALTNFHYKKLTANIFHQAGGTTSVQVHLNGMNPDFYGGHPLDFNLNLSGPVLDLIKGLGAETQ